jgi:hypothetical protein
MSGREPIMTALLNLLTSSIAGGFTGTTVKGSPVVTGIPITLGLFAGLPVSSAVTPEDVFILSVDSGSQVTLTDNATQAAATAVFTSGFATTGRRLKLWSQVDEQPALFLRNVGDTYPERATRMPPKTIMNCEAWIYSNVGADPDVVPAVTLNNLLDAIETVLKPPPGFEAQTLGGIVAHCWIEGRIEMHPGDLDSQAIAVVPIRILVPSIV